MTSGRTARACLACGVRVTDGSSRCPTHKTGGTRTRRCAEPTCGTLTTGADWCPTHQHPDSRPSSWRHAYLAPDDQRNRRAAKKRDGYTCVICGRGRATGHRVEADHIIALSHGGTSNLDNLATLCSGPIGTTRNTGCHQAKTRGAITPDQVRTALASHLRRTGRA